ncbi:MAG: DUF177 domain-containing protein [Oscillospiraceae bacterium]|nr:DUF177 domain-containing protein [Oscillospiraceae bacterium]
MFEINLEPIFNNEGMVLPIEHDIDLSEVDFFGVQPFKTPCHISGQIKNVTGIVSMDANISVDYSATCDRCACPVEKAFNVEMKHTFVSSLNDESNDEFILVPTLRFDLEGLATEDVLLTIPAKILCKEECLGICSSCGKNLNEGPCSCKAPVDPRMAALLTLLEDEETEV